MHLLNLWTRMWCQSVARWADWQAARPVARVAPAKAPAWR